MVLGTYLQSLVNIGSVTVEIFLTWTNVTRTNVNFIVGICSRRSQKEVQFRLSNRKVVPNNSLQNIIPSHSIHPKLHLQMRMKSKIKHTNVTGMKKKMELESESESKLTKVIHPSKKNKVTLKADLITELNDFKERYIALEEKYKKDIEILETENTKLKEANKTFSDEVNSLKQRVQNLEAENC